MPASRQPIDAVGGRPALDADCGERAAAARPGSSGDMQSAARTRCRHTACFVEDAGFELMTTSLSTSPHASPAPTHVDDLLARNWWYHRMNLSDGRVTPGRYGDNLIPVASLLQHVDLQGMRCLDIGAMDGKMSFLMERLGGNVLSVDGVGKPTVPALIDAYGSSVRYKTGVIVENLPALGQAEGLFDFVLCAGVAYHVYSPFDLFANVRNLLKNGGVALFETAAVVDDKLFMMLNRGDYYNEYTTLWIPSTACVRYMLEFLSMRVLGESRLTTNDYQVVRQCWLVQADRPSALATQTQDPWLRTLLAQQAPGWSHEYLKPQFDHEAFESRPASAITVAPIEGERVFKLEEPAGYQAERSLLDEGTPAWRLLRAS
jgi:2-polyprenyl-3-methyl-5-hydroxy-6-metoxy-1,4-benzoquinol methylase